MNNAPRVITGILLRSNGLVLYYLSFKTEETLHYECEVSKDRNILKKIMND